MSYAYKQAKQVVPYTRETKEYTAKAKEESIDSKKCRNIGAVRKSRIHEGRGKKSEKKNGKEKSGLTSFCGPSIHEKR